MNRWILIALLVPTVALAAPKKKGKGAKKATPTEETDKTEPAPATPTATPTATTPTATTPAGTGSGSTTPPSTAPGSAPLSGQATPAGTTPAPGTQPPAGGGASGTAADTGDGDDKGGPDVDTLRQEYLSLRDELFKSRARANAVAGQLYSTRMQIKFTWGSARYYGVSKASIRLDGATVFEDATGAIATDDGIRFDGYVAPGRHLVTFHVEATGKDDDSFTSVTESQIVVKAVANKDLVVSAKGKDNGDIAYEWKRSEKGSYGLGIDVTVKSIAQAGAKGKK